jgi:serine/threonine protein kinase
MIGETISHFKVLEKIGGGGMGVVYKAQDLRLDRFVALKFLPPELTRDPESRARFVHEAKAASALDHNNICTVYEIGEAEDGRSFIAMAYYEGETLHKILAHGALPVHQVVDYAFQIAQALFRAHSSGIVHRDLKPANIIITKDGIAKLLDFGLAKLIGGTILTKSGSTTGTAAYMSPEQARGESIDSRTDIWSLGVVLYEMLTGTRPFKGEFESALLYSITNADYEPITKARPDVPIELGRVVARCLQKDASKRYQSAEELIVDIKRCRLEPVQTGIFKKRAFTFSMIIVAVLAIGFVLYTLFVKPRDSAQPLKSTIAVLPFKNLSDRKEDDYFSDGIVEDIGAELSRVRGIHVLPRATALKFKSTDLSFKDIGRELHVGTLLIGSIRRSDAKVRIVAQAIDAESGEMWWTETYERESKDILVIQSAVASAISKRVSSSLISTGLIPATASPSDGINSSPSDRSSANPPTSDGSQMAGRTPSTSDRESAKTKGTSPRRWAVVIGISEYANKGIPDLPYAGHDAMSYASFLASPAGGGYDLAHIRVLLNKDATIQNVREALIGFLSQAIDIDIITIYFAGHGGPQPDIKRNIYIYTYDTDVTKMSTTALAMWDFTAILNRYLVARQVVLLFDACHESSLIPSDTLKSPLTVKDNQVNGYLADLAKTKKGLLVFTASDVGEPSQNAPEFGYGIFTYYLMQGLKGRADVNSDGRVALGEVLNYVQGNVKRSTKGLQNPVASGSFDPDLPLSLIAK